MRLAYACLLNAQALLDDARLLLWSPRGAFLLVEALEELYKARYVVRSSAASWRDWWIGFRRHDVKLGEVSRYAPDVPDALDDFLRFREQCLYVEVTDDGAPSPPSRLAPVVRKVDTFGWALWIEREIEATREDLRPPRTFTLPVIVP